MMAAFFFAVPRAGRIVLFSLPGIAKIYFAPPP